VVQTAACGGGAADPVAALGEDFPDRAPAVLRAGGGFTQVSGRFVPEAQPRGAWLDRLRVELPGEASEPILLHGQKGFEARVIEAGAQGPARPVEHAIAYAREAGVSVWSEKQGGVEEWIHVPAARASAERAAASWKIQGASVRQRGSVIELAGADGAARARMTAPAAFAASGKQVPVWLVAGAPAEDGSPTVDLFVDGGGEAVLVDPEWQGAAPMTTQRFMHAAAHLPNDQVLVSGGTDGFAGAVNSGELYTPAFDQWTATASMGQARICHTLSPLTDGTAIVAGGLDEFQDILGAAERYDPGQDVWNASPTMNYSRMNHAATSLSDGRVLVTGGRSNGPDIPLAPFHPHPRAHHGAKAAHGAGVPPSSGPKDLFGGGGVTCWNYNPGGGSGSGGPGTISSAEIYDPFFDGTEHWGSVAFMNENRERHTATLLQDGTVLAAGGIDSAFFPDNPVLDSGEVYDPMQDTWTPVSNSMSSLRADFTATLLGDGTVLLAGGFDGSSPATASVDIYTPGVSGGSGGAGTFTPGPPMNVARMQHVASILPNGHVLVAGGTDGVSSLDSAEDYDPVAQTWTVVPNMLNAAAAPVATPLQSGYVLVAGGYDPTQDPEGLSNAELYIWAYPLGWSCNAGSDCQSGFCADGVCCNTACTDPCYQCASQGVVVSARHASKAPSKVHDATTSACCGCAAAPTQGGSATPDWSISTDGCCMPAPFGQPDPHKLCATTDVSTCGLDGLCDGNGDCAFYDSGTLCSPAFCSLNTLVEANFCDGNGTCVVSGSVSCDPGLCSLSGGEGPACNSSCATDSDCAGDGYCDPGSGNCLSQQPNGQPATGTDQCLSGFLADGVCCDTPCTGICVACTAEAKGSGVDGVCGPVQAGTNPHADCADQGSVSCGTDGSCDGAGACEYYAAGTLCGAGSCMGDTVVQPSLCDGQGACVGGAMVNCAPDPCMGGTCASMCVTDADCIATGYCATSGTCAPKQPNGQPATGNDQCLSGFFADGVCCDQACTGICSACTAAKKGAGIDGVCGPVRSGTDPDGDCVDQGAASCGTRGVCDGSGACALYQAGTVCAAASCEGNTLTQASQCDGAGNCVGKGSVDCTPGNCGGSICQLVCAVDADCKVVTAYCGAGMCQPKKPAGQPAAGSNECLTGFVADGVCCDQACAGGPCDACTVAGGATADGTCTPVSGPCDDGNPCTIGDMCQGGVCVGQSAMDCPAPDACHQMGVCNAEGGCTYTAQPDGTSCDEGNTCANATCQSGVCVSVNKLDGAPCKSGNDSGVCIAGTCVPDPTVNTTSSTTTSTGTGTTTGTGGAGTTTTATTGTTGGGGSGGATEKLTGQLTGGGCLAVTPAEVPSGGGVTAFFAALAAALGRVVGRRRQGDRRRA
jgi:hypothetical protein